MVSSLGAVTSMPAQTSVTNPGVFVSETSSIAPSFLDPATDYETQGGGYIQLMYDGLFSYVNNSLTQTQPDLAFNNYTVSTNGLVYTFYLRTGVTFALQPGERTGQPFNAYVMQYSIDRAILMNDPSGPAWMIDQWIKGAGDVLGTTDMNQSQAITFLNQKSVLALNANTLQITLGAAFGGFIQTIQFPVADAISPKAIIDNEPSSYTTKHNDNFGMTSLASFFPGTANATILQNLGLPSTYNIDNSGVVPSSPSSGSNAYTWLADHSAGTGPWYLVKLVQGTEVDFAKNNNYWNRQSFQTYSPNKIQITQVAEDATRVLDLQNGKTDIGGIPASLFSQFGVSSTHPNSTVAGVNSYVYNTIDNEFIGMNMNNTLQPGQVKESSSSTYNASTLLKYTWKNAQNQTQYASPENPFTSLIFRQAWAYAFPYDTYINQALAGFAFRMQGVIPEGLLGYDGNLIAQGKIPSTDAATATSLFKQVGWQGSITLTYNTGSTARKISANLLATAINALNVGITVNVVSVAWNTYLTDVFNGGLAMFQLGWAPDFADPHDYTVPYYESNQTFTTPISYSNPYVDSLIKQAAAATSPSTRTALYTAMENNATQDFPYIYLDQSQTVILARSWIQGIGNPASDSMNAMINFLQVQNLAKGQPGVYGSTGSGFATGQSTPGFDFIALFGGLAVVAIVEVKRKRQN